MRMNDAVTDPDRTVTRVLGDLTVPNGPAFDAEGTTMYLADSARGVTYRFAVDPGTGQPGERTEFVTVEKGSPDGMMVDAEGFVWSAIWRDGPGPPVRAHRLVGPRHRCPSRAADERLR